MNFNNPIMLDQIVRQKEEVADLRQQLTEREKQAVWGLA